MLLAGVRPVLSRSVCTDPAYLVGSLERDLAWCQGPATLSQSGAPADFTPWLVFCCPLLACAS